jgi:hypothetical protein
MSRLAFLPFASVLSVSLLLLAAGCQPQLGQCEPDDAFALVIDRNGYPSYAGQAMIQEACSSCHSVGATGMARRGAPAHLNFDAAPSRSDDPTMPDMDVVERLVISRQSIFDHRFEMYSTVETGSMPPGEAGLASLIDAGFTYLDTGEPLEPVGSAAGKDVYRNWLACGGPMVTQTAEPGESDVPGAPCDAGGYTLEDAEHCYYRRTAPPIDPTWTAIYDAIIVAGGCVGCHGPGPASFIEPSQLDLSDKDAAYAAMVGVAAMGDDCAGGGDPRVVPGDANGSLLIHKLENQLADGSDICGDSMPLGVLLPPSQIAVVRQWIDDGAMDN